MNKKNYTNDQPWVFMLLGVEEVVVKRGGVGIKPCINKCLHVY